MSKEELIRLIDDFINEHGLWYEFKAWLEKHGLTASQIGFPDDE